MSKSTHEKNYKILKSKTDKKLSIKYPYFQAVIMFYKIKVKG